MIRKNKAFSLVSLFVLALVFSCSRASQAPAESTARDFMDAYYVKADLGVAELFVDGLALERVKNSLALREGLSVDGAAHQPKVRFELLETRQGADEAEFIYKVEFRPEKADPVRKKTRVKVRLREGLWKVTQFTDHDLS
jgi:hypothetical protein